MVFKDETIGVSNYAIFRLFKFDEFAPERAVTSHWVSSKVFFIIRLLLTLYSTVVLWTDIGFNPTGQFFTYFTNFTFIGLNAYLITSSIHHFRYLYTNSIQFFIDQSPIFNYLYIYLYSTVITNNIVTPVVYWALLSTNQINPLRTWLNTSVHGVSLALIMIDVIFNRMKVPVQLVVFPLITMILYMLFAFIIYAVQDYWIYPFLDWSEGGKAALWYIVVALVCVIAFFVQVLIHWLRDFIARRLTKSETEDSDPTNPDVEKIEVVEHSDH